MAPQPARSGSSYLLVEENVRRLRRSFILKVDSNIRLLDLSAELDACRLATAGEGSLLTTYF